MKYYTTKMINYFRKINILLAIIFKLIFYTKMATNAILCKRNKSQSKNQIKLNLALDVMNLYIT